MTKTKRKAAGKGTLQPIVGTPCIRCGNVIEEDDPRKTAAGWMCPDCYFQELGDEIERHPICNPRRANAAGEVRRNAVTSTGLLGTSGVER